MKGSYHYHEPAKRYYVSIYWDGKPWKIWRYKGEPIWHKNTAIKLLNKIRSEIDDKEGGFNIKAYLPESPLSLFKYSEEWLIAFTGADSTRKFYAKFIKKAIDHFGADFDIRNFTYTKLKIFYNALNPLADRTKYHCLSTLKGLLKSAEKDGYLKVPPFPKLPEGLPQEIKYLTYEQQATVLSFIPERHRGVFEFAMEYGLRIGEVIALQKDCITDSEVIIKRSVSDGELVQHTKTKMVRRLGLTKHAKEILSRQYKSLSFYVFVREGDKPYTWKSLTKRWKTACRKSGISINLYNAFRHSLGCQLMDRGVELEAVRDILGHTSTNMTRRYAQRSVQRLTNILEFRGESTDTKGGKRCQ